MAICNNYLKTDTTIILMRHGQTIFNLEKRITGQKFDPELTPNGILQAKKTEEILYQEHYDIISLVVSSNKTRTNQTAEIVNTRLNKPIMLDLEIQEISHEDFDGRYGHEVFDIIDSSPHNEHPAGGESLKSFSHRIAKAICKYFYMDETGVLLVSHGRSSYTASTYFYGEAQHLENSQLLILKPETIENLPGKCSIFFENTNDTAQC
jgi:broad specificity phosphatase PhoE